MLVLPFILLALAACSTPADQPESLETQFGTANDEAGIDVTTVSTGRIYNLSKDSRPYYQFGEEAGVTQGATLRRYDSSGTLVWAKQIDTYTCTYDSYVCGLQPRSIETTTQGDTYYLGSITTAPGDCTYVQSAYVKKVSSSGSVMKTVKVGSTGSAFGSPFSANLALSVDGSGNFYVGLEKTDVDTEGCEASGTTQVVQKYSADGTLQWQRTSSVGAPTDMVVTATGSLYVAGPDGLARYTTSGRLVWNRAIGPLENVVVSGSNIYTRYRKDVRKFDADGNQFWLKTQSGLNTIIGQDLSGDTGGNAYLSGKYAAGTDNYNPFVRKLNSNGSVLWTKTFGTPSYDDARGVATISGMDVYVTGETQGSLAHPNYGGPQNRDGYLRRLNSSGNPVWSK